jgi:REP element-mobilizing transposase RayT
MRYDSEIHHRRSLRLKGYDYTQAGAYFVTICCQHRRCVFRDIVDGEMRMNEAGQIVQAVWEELPIRCPGVDTDAFVIMPNHVHGIVTIGLDAGVGAQFIAPMHQGAMNQGAMNRAPTLGEVVRVFKAVSTYRIRRRGCPWFAWQRNYYEHIIRDDEDLTRIREYIRLNPVLWAEDAENPDRIAPNRRGNS